MSNSSTPPHSVAMISQSGHELRTTTMAIRVVLTWFGVRACLPDMRRADSTMKCMVHKKRLDTGHRAFRILVAVKDHVVQLIVNTSQPFPRRGVRLVRLDRLLPLLVQLTSVRAELIDAAQQFDVAFGYHGRFGKLFGLDRCFLNIEPRPALVNLSPELFHREFVRVGQLFEHASRMSDAVAA